MGDGIFFKNQNAAFDKLFKDLDKYAKEVIAELDAEMGAGLEDMAREAKRLAPVSPEGGSLRGTINVEKEKPLSYNLKANARYAAYVEFGTGPYAQGYVPSLDPEWQEYAITFKKSTPGHTRQQPFFYPSVRRVFPLMIEKMKKVIQK